jgi:hypothetical protein
MTLMVSAVLLAFTPILSQAALQKTSLPDIDLSAYALPDGRLPVFCLSASDGDNQTFPTGPHCPLCTLAKSLAVPPRNDISPIPVRFSTSFFHAIWQIDAKPRAVWSGTWSRAPPAI